MDIDLDELKARLLQRAEEIDYTPAVHAIRHAAAALDQLQAENAKLKSDLFHADSQAEHLHLEVVKLKSELEGRASVDTRKVSSSAAVRAEEIRRMKTPADDGPIKGEAIAQRMMRICGCKGKFDCDCVSVENQARSELWYERNASAPTPAAKKEGADE